MLVRSIREGEDWSLAEMAEQLLVVMGMNLLYFDKLKMHECAFGTT